MILNNCSSGYTWGSCRSAPLSLLRLLWKNEWISFFSTELVRSREVSERAFSSQRVREKVNATTGVCCLSDRYVSSVCHTARSWNTHTHTFALYAHTVNKCNHICIHQIFYCYDNKQKLHVYERPLVENLTSAKDKRRWGSEVSEQSCGSSAWLANVLIFYTLDKIHLHLN